MRLYKTVGRFLKIGTLLSTTGLIATVSLQIFARFFLANAPSWTEEASRIFFIYAVSFAAGLALKTNYYVHLDMFYNSFPPKMKRILNLIIPMVTFLLFALMDIYAVQLVMIGLPERSPSLGVPMAFAFFSMFIMATAICFYAWEKIKRELKNHKP